MGGINLCGGTRRQTDSRPLQSIKFQDFIGTQRPIQKQFLVRNLNLEKRIITLGPHIHRWLIAVDVNTFTVMYIPIQMFILNKSRKCV